MRKTILTILTCAAGSLLSSAALFAQSSDIPRTAYGHPDMQGTYTFRTITPLERPVELAEKATLTAEEAAEWEA